MRIPTLMLGIAPVLIGVSAACRVIGMRGADGLPACGILTASSACDAGTGRIITLGLLCLLVALFLQIAVNFANDYSDGVRGTDAHRTAAVRQYTVESDFQFLENGATAEEERQARELNGPTRLVAGGVTPRAVLMAAIVNAVLACVCGLAVIVITGYWWLVFVGALCVTAAWFYVGGSHPYGYFGFGELAAFVFFGPVAALGTQFVLCGQVNGNGVYGAVVIGAVSAAVMAVNNLRDVNTDRERQTHARRTHRRARIHGVPVRAHRPRHARHGDSVERDVDPYGFRSAQSERARRLLRSARRNRAHTAHRGRRIQCGQAGIP